MITINDKKDRQEEYKEMNADKLIQLADNKYFLLKESEELDAPSAEEEKIMALYTAVKNLTKNRTRHKDPELSNNEKARRPIKEQINEYVEVQTHKSQDGCTRDYQKRNYTNYVNGIVKNGGTFIQTQGLSTIGNIIINLPIDRGNLPGQI